MANGEREDYDGKAVLAAGERLLPRSVEQAGKIGERFATDTEKKFGPAGHHSRGLGARPLDG